MSERSGPRESFASILTLDPHGDGRFSARLEDFWGDTLPADPLARAALAAAQSCEGKELHSLHACFVRSAPPAVPIELRVESLEDGRRMARRQVRLLGDDGLLCQVVASFAAPGEGLGYQDQALEAELPAAEKLPSTVEYARAEGWPEMYARGPIEFRRIGSLWRDAGAGESTVEHQWVRPRAVLPADPSLHMAALVFLSGFYSHWEFERRVGPKFANDHFMALDHALWVHRSARWDDWWLLRGLSQISHAGRAVSRREIYTRKGVLVASAAQEALIASA